MNFSEQVIALHRQVARLKELTRRGWVARGVPAPESVADHSLGVCVLATLFSSQLGLDRGKLLTMATLHDLCEAVCGDVIPADGMDPAAKLDRERAAMEQVLGGVHGADELLSLWLDMALGRTEEGRLIKDLDTLEMVLQADHYERSGPRDLEEFFISGEAIQGATPREVLQAIKVRRAGRSVLDHLAPGDPPRPVDLIVGFGVFDLSVPRHCADLYLRGLAPRILFTGGVGAGSGDLQEPEADAFRRQALAAGVPESAIVLETRSTNTLENAQLSRALLSHGGLDPASALLVALPHRQRRVWLTCRKQWPGMVLVNQPPSGELEDLAQPFGGLDPYLREMVGELDRIQRYGKQGDVALDSEPESVLQARQLLEPLKQ